ncbi:hypothetical protein VTJ04DRAFT_10082 [Mycothermus thermophilus]|uniref:uncharacterized protein n=1 Tax=Humicola insolens TaxID=85995 RepID=UPI00374477FC
MSMPIHEKHLTKKHAKSLPHPQDSHPKKHPLKQALCPSMTSCLPYAARHPERHTVSYLPSQILFQSRNAIALIN